MFRHEIPNFQDIIYTQENLEETIEIVAWNLKREKLSCEEIERNGIMERCIHGWAFADKIDNGAGRHMADYHEISWKRCV